MRRRGPDAEGYAELGQTAFGFRRLAIRDLSEAANQPMLDPSGRFMLVFNGELYHLDALKSRLRPETVFRTHSDTEVLFHCLEQLGLERTLPLLDGIFAFAWYDNERGSLALARDRCGVKPLYYALNHRLLLFCSEYDLLLCHEEFRDASPNPDALAHYLHLGFVPDGEALYKQTFLLPHGHYLTTERNGRVALNSYYAYPWKNCDTPSLSLRDVLSESVCSQLVSDVPIGVFQSGGIDSSLVSALAINENPELESFTIGVESGGSMDESYAARSLAHSLHMRHHLRVIADSDVFSTLIEQNTEAFSEPFADYSSLPTLLLAQFARERITVALSGDGGDELFWGYPRHRMSAAYAPFFLKKKARRNLHIIWEKLRRNGMDIPLDLLRHLDFAHFAFQKTFITGARAWAGRIFPHEAQPPFFFKKIAEEIQASPPENTCMWMNVLRKIEFDFHLQRVLLKVDRASLYHSLEVRVPLLSNAMLEASTCYAHTACIRDDMGKVPLRKLLARLLPDTELCALPKKGFTVPMDAWTRGLLHDQIGARLHDIPPEWVAFFDKKQLEALWQSCRNENNAWLVWAVFTLFEWSERRLTALRSDYQRFAPCPQ